MFMVPLLLISFSFEGGPPDFAIVNDTFRLPFVINSRSVGRLGLCKNFPQMVSALPAHFESSSLWEAIASPKSCTCLCPPSTLPRPCLLQPHWLPSVTRDPASSSWPPLSSLISLLAGKYIFMITLNCPLGL